VEWFRVSKRLPSQWRLTTSAERYQVNREARSQQRVTALGQNYRASKELPIWVSVIESVWWVTKLVKYVVSVIGLEFETSISDVIVAANNDFWWHCSAGPDVISYRWELSLSTDTPGKSTPHFFISVSHLETVVYKHFRGLTDDRPGKLNPPKPTSLLWLFRHVCLIIILLFWLQSFTHVYKMNTATTSVLAIQVAYWLILFCKQRFSCTHLCMVDLSSLCVLLTANDCAFPPGITVGMNHDILTTNMISLNSQFNVCFIPPVVPKISVVRLKI